MQLLNKTALVTGAGSGIGRASAVALAGHGARVALVGRRQDRLDEVARLIGEAATVIPGDVSLDEDIQRIAELARSAFGPVNILVNNAGYLVPGTAETHTRLEWETTFNTNVRAVWLLSKAVLPQMREHGGGSIINISSVLSLVGAKNRVAYAASKGAVTSLTRAMALDHAKENIRVNCVCPGFVETELVERFISEAPDPAEAMRQRTALHPMGRLGKPEDVAALVVYLAGDGSSWVTGAAFPVDGGFTAR